MFVYILECADQTYYTGVTNNPELRVEQHQAGIDPDAYTFTRRPVKLAFLQMFNSPLQAFDFETRIKKWSRAKKQALINGHYHKLPGLSKKKFKKK
jgi:putative endonuclease